MSHWGNDDAIYFAPLHEPEGFDFNMGLFFAVAQEHGIARFPGLQFHRTGQTGKERVP